MSENIKLAVYTELEKSFERIRKERHGTVAALLVSWVTDNAKPIPDLPDRVKKFSEEVDAMCREMRIKFGKDGIVVKVNGSAEQTFKKLKFGTNWFRPYDKDLEMFIVAGLSKRFGS